MKKRSTASSAVEKTFPKISYTYYTISFLSVNKEEGRMKRMKNNYEIYCDATVVHVVSKTHGRQEILIDTEDLEKLLDFKKTWSVYKPARSHTHYATARIKKGDKWGNIDLHRFLMNPEKGLVVDHINGNGLDNRKENLRVVTQAQNKQNLRGAQIDNKTGVRGVFFDTRRNCYVAQVHSEGKSIFYKSFKSLDEAELAVKEARKKYFQFSND
ncbi:HNH endonuclease [Bacillus sp. COPE52]|nr:HNH endonuclease [Bacillus sp. COPE52]